MVLINVWFIGEGSLVVKCFDCYKCFLFGMIRSRRFCKLFVCGDEYYSELKGKD